MSYGSAVSMLSPISSSTADSVSLERPFSAASTCPPPPSFPLPLVASLGTEFAALKAREESLRRLDAELSQQKIDIINKHKAAITATALTQTQSGSTTPTTAHSPPSAAPFSSSILASASRQPSTPQSGARISRPGTANGRSSNSKEAKPAPVAAFSVSSRISTGKSSRLSGPNTPRQPSSLAAVPPPPFSSSFSAPTSTVASVASSRRSSRQGSLSMPSSAAAAVTASASSTSSSSSADASGDGSIAVDPVLASMSHAAALRYQQARINALTASLATVSKDLHNAQTTIQQQNQRLNAHTETSTKQAKLLVAQEGAMDREKSAVNDLKDRIAVLTTELTASKKAQLSAEKKWKEKDKSERSAEVKLQRLVGEVDKWKKKAETATAAGGSGAESKDGVGHRESELSVLRREVVEVKEKNALLLSQRNEMIGAFKKQMRLIDVLKKQKMHMEAARMLQFTEEEFTKCIELGAVV